MTPKTTMFIEIPEEQVGRALRLLTGQVDVVGAVANISVPYNRNISKRDAQPAVPRGVTKMGTPRRRAISNTQHPRGYAEARLLQLMEVGESILRADAMRALAREGIPNQSFNTVLTRLLQRNVLRKGKNSEGRKTITLIARPESTQTEGQ